MIRAIRRQLAEIDRHSARRRRTAWAQLMDAALVVTFVLAPLATLVTHLLVERRRVGEVVLVRLGLDDDGTITGKPIRPEQVGDGWSFARPYGQAEVSIVTQARGWPFATRTTRPPPRVELRVFADPDASWDQLPPDAPVIAAIDDALDHAAGSTRFGLDRWPGWEVRHVRHGWSWVANAGTWWIAMFLVTAVAILAVQMATLEHHGVRQARRRQRVARGLCAACGYDLHGLEFNERCPECGALVQY